MYPSLFSKLGTPLEANMKSNNLRFFPSGPSNQFPWHFLQRPNFIFNLLFLFFIFSLPSNLNARILQVGPGKSFAKPSLASAAVQNGDTVEIAPSLYEGDACTWSADNLTLRSPSQYAHLEAKGAYALGKGTWVIAGKNTTVENIEFSGATVAEKNGAGIRQEGEGLIVRHCFFHDNEDGILAGANANSEILIEHSEFSHNGFGDGYTHNMYINQVKKFTLQYCYTHHAKVGHNIKSRALRNEILYNRSFDGTDGTASYELDLPNGGVALIIGNVFQQGPATENPTILSYGAEGLTNPNSSIAIINNTFVNDKQGGNFISLASATPSAKLVNNLFVGNGTIITGKKPDSSNNLITQSPSFFNVTIADYRLKAGSPAIDQGIDPGQWNGATLIPSQVFFPSDSVRIRKIIGLPDIGAYEFDPTASIKNRIKNNRNGNGNGTGKQNGNGNGSKKKSSFLFPIRNQNEWEYSVRDGEGRNGLGRSSLN